MAELLLPFQFRLARWVEWQHRYGTGATVASITALEGK
jgi:heme A synthase